MTGTALVVEDHPLYRDALSHVLQRIFGADGVRTASTAEEGINIQMISTSEIKITVVIEAKYTELAVRVLHKAFELEQG